MKQKTKDTIALLILFLFVSSPFIRAFYGFVDSLKLHRPIISILWYGSVALILTVCGLFLIIRFINMMHDIEYYKSTAGEKEGTTDK